MLDYLKDRIASGYGFLISGRGGSGKSTLLNNMIDCIPYDQSVLVSQESDELYSEHPQIQFEHTLSVKRKDCSIEYSLEDELRLGLLQDIDNFVIGEIKGGVRELSKKDNSSIRLENSSKCPDFDIALIKKQKPGIN